MKALKIIVLALTFMFATEWVLAESEDAGHGADYRTFHSDGTVVMGAIGDSYTADLVMYLAGNQFMVMEELINDFQAKHPGIATVYVETIPPGQILNGQLLQQGEIPRLSVVVPQKYYSSIFCPI